MLYRQQWLPGLSSFVAAIVATVVVLVAHRPGKPGHSHSRGELAARDREEEEEEERELLMPKLR